MGIPVDLAGRRDRVLRRRAPWVVSPRSMRAPVPVYRRRVIHTPAGREVPGGWPAVAWMAVVRSRPGSTVPLSAFEERSW